jgi:nucleoside-diphosphate-sugar epimerase
VYIAVVGPTGVLGRALVPLLLARGHAVRALARSASKAAVVLPHGLEVVEHDLLAPDAAQALPGLLAGCDAVAHIATAIPGDFDAPGAWDANTALRTAGVRALLDAALAAGVGCYVQQSIVMAYPDRGDAWITEETPLDASPARARTGNPVRVMEGMVRAVPAGDLRWCILRGGVFVGPGTFQERLIADLHAGAHAVAGDGRNYLSPVHIADVAAAFAAALERAPAGSVLNVVDEPLREGDYADRLADAIGAPRPPRNRAISCPASQRCSNVAARALLGWAPTHPVIPLV